MRKVIVFCHLSLDGVADVTKLKLLEEKTFDSGAIALHYAVLSR